ncbi:MAG: Rrf2 family transcriptional regulator [Candidatus Kapabacteria bacterium]|nr:Rrf2 family transcriptional regulator [Candidatus Kapabacteria bacterium]MDW8011709.1 Rrf2 family transcriptional regulator [Bacteroidota bacterium]
MLRLSRRVEYALLALYHLARHPGIATAREIACAYNLSSEFLAKVLQQLSRARLIRAHHGVHGGYSLLQPPEMITLSMVIDAVEGEWGGLVECRGDEHRCHIFPQCTIRHPLAVLEHRLHDLLASTTLAELVGYSRVEL